MTRRRLSRDRPGARPPVLSLTQQSRPSQPSHALQRSSSSASSALCPPPPLGLFPGRPSTNSTTQRDLITPIIGRKARPTAIPPTGCRGVGRCPGRVVVGGSARSEPCLGSSIARPHRPLRCHPLSPNASWLLCTPSDVLRGECLQVDRRLVRFDSNSVRIIHQGPDSSVPAVISQRQEPISILVLSSFFPSYLRLRSLLPLWFIHRDVPLGAKPWLGRSEWSSELETFASVKPGLELHAKEGRDSQESRPSSAFVITLHPCFRAAMEWI